MSIAVDAIAGAPLAAAGESIQPLPKIPRTRRAIAKPDGDVTPEPR